MNVHPKRFFHRFHAALSIAAAALCAAAMGGCFIKYDDGSSRTVTKTENGNTTTTRTVTVSSDGTSKTTVVANGKTIVGGADNLPPRVIDKSVPVAAGVHGLNVRSEYGGIAFVPTSDGAQISVHAEITLSDSSISEADRKKYLA